VDAAKAATATFTLKSFALNVATAGDGSGAVTSNPAGVNCGADCAEVYTIGTQVTLTVQPAADSLFGGWSGACAGTAATCVVPVDAAKNVTATFNLKTFALDVSKEGEGSGSVTSQPEGIACGDDCDETYPIRTDVTLNALPDDGSVFTGWTGACTNTEPECTVTVDEDTSVTATFELESTGVFLPLLDR
jgi:uncharacterized repeat protein (TIGR02543 family)